MKKWFIALSLVAAGVVAYAQTSNPLPGYVWTYFGPTLGGGWGPAPFNGLLIGIATNPVNLYVKAGGTDTNNYCNTTDSPCATFQRAVDVCQLIDMNGGNCVVQSIDTSPRSPTESISVTNPLRGAGNGTAVPNIGTRWPSQIIIDGNNQITLAGAPTGTCYGVASSNNAIVGVRRIVIAPTAAACQDGLFAQLGGGINVFDGVTLGATGINGCKAHAENSAYGVQFWENYTLAGNGNCGYSVGGGGATILISAGVGTITGNPTLNELVFASSGGTFQTNIANPWGATPGAMSGGGLILAPGGTVENNGNAVAWPGTGTSYLEGGSYNTLPSPSIASDANIGAGGTVVLSSGATPYSGAFTMTAGAAAGSAGSLTVTMPGTLSVRRSNGANTQCRASLLSTGSGTWENGTIILGSVLLGTQFTINWRNNAIGLTNGQTYSGFYDCFPA